MISGIFTLAKQQDYFQGENPARDSAINPKAAEPQETYAYSLEEIQTILACSRSRRQQPSPSRRSWVCGTAKYKDYFGKTTGTARLYVSRSIWNGRISDPKTRKGRAPVPVIRQLAETTGNASPSFGKSACWTDLCQHRRETASSREHLVNRVILPALNRCEVCRTARVEPPEGKP